MVEQNQTTTQTQDHHRELFDPRFAAEQRRLGRRRVIFITLVSTVAGVLILGSFLVYGWVYGENLPATNKDRFSLLTAPNVSDAANSSISLRLDRERITKHRDRFGVVRLSYRYDDNTLKVDCDVEVYRDDVQSRLAYAKTGHDALRKLRDEGWTLSVPAGLGRVDTEDESTYGSLVSKGKSEGHFFLFRIDNKLMRGKIEGYHFANKDVFNQLLTDAVKALGIYNP